MNIINKIDISVFSLLVLLFIYANARKQTQKTLLQSKLFRAMIITLFVATAAEALSNTLDGLPNSSIIPWSIAVNTVLFLFTPLPVLCWVLYSDFQINRNEKRVRKLAIALSVLPVFNTGMTLASLFTGWYFSIDANNLYHRGPYFFVHAIPFIFIYIYVFVFILKNREKLSAKHFYTLLFFAVPTIIGAYVQLALYGVALTACSMTLSVLLIYFNIQDTNLSTDYLTGTFNRRILDSIVKEKISLCSETRTFSGILLDLDNFKIINDTYGHITGDEALSKTVEILKSSLRANDIITRYGGDEFLILLDNVDSKVLTETLERIQQHLNDFNRSAQHPYSLAFSYGCAEYDDKRHMSARDFIKHLDTLMYENKKQKAAIAPKK